jgi:hypothetical protein
MVSYRFGKKGVDGRVTPGHDGFWIGGVVVVKRADGPRLRRVFRNSLR